jgi:hypothetical protein
VSLEKKFWRHFNLSLTFDFNKYDDAAAQLRRLFAELEKAEPRNAHQVNSIFGGAPFWEREAANNYSLRQLQAVSSTLRYYEGKKLIVV